MKNFEKAYNTSNHQLSFNLMLSIVKQHGGNCLSSIYMGEKTHLLWECSDGHQWKATPDKIKQGKWCPHCAGSFRLDTKEMIRIAQERGGKCLSKEYINSKTKLKWECSEGHQWKALPTYIKSGSWCPECSTNTKSKL